MKPYRLITVFIASILFLAQSADACTGIRVTAKDGSVIYGRTLEYGLPMPTNIIVVPSGIQFTGTTKPNTQNGKKWTVKYAFTGVAPYNYQVAIDGVNSQGLAAGTFLFPNYANYPELTSKNESQAVAPWELTTYILSQFSTIDEVKKGLSDVTVVQVTAPEMNNSVPPVHYIIHDAQGNSLVIEYVNGQLKTYDDPLGVITNSPTFDWHMTNLANYINLNVNNVPAVQLNNNVDLTALGQGSGLLGMPGDFTPPSRFIRAVVFSQSTLPIETGDDGVFRVFHILNQFDIPKGSVRAKDGNQTELDYTVWTSVANLKDKKYYFRTYKNQQVRMVDLMKISTQSNKIQTFPMTSDTEMPQATPITN